MKKYRVFFKVNMEIESERETERIVVKKGELLARNLIQQAGGEGFRVEQWSPPALEVDVLMSGTVFAEESASEEEEEEMIEMIKDSIEKMVEKSGRGYEAYDIDVREEKS